MQEQLASLEVQHKGHKHDSSHLRKFSEIRADSWVKVWQCATNMHQGDPRGNSPLVGEGLMSSCTRAPGCAKLAQGLQHLAARPPSMDLMMKLQKTRRGATSAPGAILTPFLLASLKRNTPSLAEVSPVARNKPTVSQFDQACRLPCTEQRATCQGFHWCDFGVPTHLGDLSSRNHKPCDRSVGSHSLVCKTAAPAECPQKHKTSRFCRFFCRSETPKIWFCNYLWCLCYNVR